MTDKKIIKALRCIAGKRILCASCGYRDKVGKCWKASVKDAIDLIERLQFELSEEKAKGGICADVIARQDKELAKIADYKELYEDLKGEHLEMIRGIKNCRAEAIREFAERLGTVRIVYSNFGEMVYVKDIGNIIREMMEKVGE